MAFMTKSGYSSCW